MSAVLSIIKIIVKCIHSTFFTSILAFSPSAGRVSDSAATKMSGFCLWQIKSLYTFQIILLYLVLILLNYKLDILAPYVDINSQPVYQNFTNIQFTHSVVEVNK